MNVLNQALHVFTDAIANDEEQKSPQCQIALNVINKFPFVEIRGFRCHYAIERILRSFPRLETFLFKF